MLAIAAFLELTNQNLLLGVMPESLGLLLFGIGLIALTVILRKILSRFESVEDEKREVKH
jgi:hypothetical protein